MQDKTHLIIHGIITLTGLTSIAFRGKIGWDLAQLGVAMLLAAWSYKTLLWFVKVDPDVEKNIA